ncbi:hypothetical protein HDV03_005456 [Kappamyces sp. JEL0829]|nr:hypothetical protein HDV03_005456 [Kappamyces sp. JEL0829]KAJ3370563.1 hypothetical protein HDU91_006104 [Kappamyces sp. JEL0680]
MNASKLGQFRQSFIALPRPPNPNDPSPGIVAAKPRERLDTRNNSCISEYSDYSGSSYRISGIEGSQRMSRDSSTGSTSSFFVDTLRRWTSRQVSQNSDAIAEIDPAFGFVEGSERQLHLAFLQTQKPFSASPAMLQTCAPMLAIHTVKRGTHLQVQGTAVIDMIWLLEGDCYISRTIPFENSISTRKPSTDATETPTDEKTLRWKLITSAGNAKADFDLMAGDAVVVATMKISDFIQLVDIEHIKDHIGSSGLFPIIHGQQISFDRLECHGNVVIHRGLMSCLKPSVSSKQ